LDLFKPGASKLVLESLPRRADIVLSDVSPEFSGIRIQDIGLANDLSEICFEIAKKILKEEGSFVCKVFQCAELKIFVGEMKKYFASVELFKPKSSLKSSSEVYVVARKFSLIRI
jgi:23S rRNA (uridine2552-2'-O)-methyltransferase